jgi:hypothetical protein
MKRKKYIGRGTEREADRKINREIGRETDRETDRKINREIDREQETEKQKYGGHSETQITNKKV